jgi:two-component system response regulator AtoC
MFILKIIYPDKKRETYYLNTGEFEIGSKSSNDIIINDQTVSRKHCKLTVKKGKPLCIIDNGSKNGITVNGEKVKRGELHNGDRILLGRIKLLIEEIADNDGVKFVKGEKFKKISNRDSGETRDVFVSTGISLISMIKAIEEKNSSKYFDIINKYLLSAEDILIGKRDDKGIKILYLDGDKELLLDSINLVNNNIEITDSEIYYADYKDFFILCGKSDNFPITLFNSIINVYASLFDCADSLPVSGVSKRDSDEYIINPNFIFRSKIMKTLVSRAKKLAKSNINIMLRGESGVGKELLASFIHYHSKRKNGPFVTLNCAAIPENLLESELFGHEKGAFTGAINKKVGKFELANKGTLFLDEVTSTSTYFQAKLLRAIQFGEFYRLGGNEPVKVDVRVISATNSNIEKMIEDGKFRDDLYFRLVAEDMFIPPLRDRKDDILELVKFFIDKYSKENKKQITGISDKALKILLSYDFPGNIRELEHEIAKMVVLADEGDILREKYISEKLKNKTRSIKMKNETWDLNENIEDLEKEIIIRAFDNFKNKSKVAKELNISRTTLDMKLKKYKIEVN